MVRNTKKSKVILLPFAFVLFIVGWCLAYVGSVKFDRTLDNAKERHYAVEFGVIPPEEQHVQVR
jgi:hypothetical protein